MIEDEVVFDEMTDNLIDAADEMRGMRDLIYDLHQRIDYFYKLLEPFSNLYEIAGMDDKPDEWLVGIGAHAEAQTISFRNAYLAVKGAT